MAARLLLRDLSLRVDRVFFVYDHRKHREEDDPKDAILYFHPPLICVDEQIALVGGLVGTLNFCMEVLQQDMPSLISLTTLKFALLKTGPYILGLSAGMQTPDDFIKQHLQFLWNIFCLFQGSLEGVRQRVCPELFNMKLSKMWNSYFSYCLTFGDPLTQAFHVVPYVDLPLACGSMFMNASHILQQAQQQAGVLGGLLLNKSRVLCSQLSNELTRCLLVLSLQTHHFPCQEVKPVFDLPGGVRLVHAYVMLEDLDNVGPQKVSNFNSRNINPSSILTNGCDPSASKTSPVKSMSSSTEAQEFFCDTVSDFSSAPDLNAVKKDISFPSPGTDQSPDSVFNSEMKCNHPVQTRANESPNSVLDSGVQCSLSFQTSAGLKRSDFVVEMPEKVSFESQETFEEELHEELKLADTSNSEHTVTMKSSSDRSQKNEICDDEINSDIFPVDKNESQMLGTSGRSLTGVSVPEIDDITCRSRSDLEGVSELPPSEYGSESFAETSNFDTESGVTVDDAHGIGMTSDFDTESSVTVEDVCSNVKTSDFDTESSVTVEDVCSNVKTSDFDTESSVTVEDVCSNVKTSNFDTESSVTVEDVCSNVKTSNFDTESSVTVEDVCSNVKTSNFDTESSVTVEDVCSNVKTSNFDTESSVTVEDVCSNVKTSDFDTESSVTVEDVCSNVKISDFDTESGVTVDGTCGSGDSVVAVVVLSGKTSHLVTATEACEIKDRNTPPQANSPQYKGDDSDIQIDRGSDTKDTMIVNLDTAVDAVGNSLRGSEEDSLSVINKKKAEKEETNMETDADKDRNIDSSQTSPFILCDVLFSRSEISSPMSDVGTGDSSTGFDSHKAEMGSPISPVDIGVHLDFTHSGTSSVLTLSDDLLSPNKEKISFETTLQMSASSGNEDVPSVPPEGSRYKIEASSSDVGGTSSESQFTRGMSSDSILQSQESFSPREKWADWQENVQYCGRKPVLLYVQGHMGTMLILILDDKARATKQLIHALWKSSVAKLAELDFAVNASDGSPTLDANRSSTYNYLRYDCFTQALKGSVLDPVTSLANELVSSSVQMHNSFCQIPTTQDVIFSSHTTSCYGHKTLSSETFFQVPITQQSGTLDPSSNTFCLKQLANQKLYNDHNLVLL